MSKTKVQVFMAQEIRKRSWLMDDEYAEFRAAYDYASGQTYAIEALSKLRPEQVYHLYGILERGLQHAIRCEVCNDVSVVIGERKLGCRCGAPYPPPDALVGKESGARKPSQRSET